MSCGNVPVKNNANRFLLQKVIPIKSSYSLKPAKSVIIIYTSQNDKPLHGLVGSPKNPNYMRVVLF